MDNFHEDYKFICVIGEGSYGRVEKAITTQNQFVAIKHIKFQQGFQGVPPTALREMSNLKILSDHSNLIKLKEIIYKYKQKSLKLVFDYYHYNLRQFLDIRDHTISQTNIKLMIKQILTGVNYCHKKKIMHRDLKPQNILVDIDGNIKIGDFGLSRVFNVKDNDLSPKIQTLNYRAPQVLLGSFKYDYSVDIWAIGCIFAQIYLGKPIFNGRSQIQQIFQIFQTLGTPKQQYWLNLKQFPNFKAKFPKWNGKKLSQIIPNIPQVGLSLLQKMLQMNPKKRISASQALQHDYLKQNHIISSSSSTQLSDVET